MKEVDEMIKKFIKSNKPVTLSPELLVANCVLNKAFSKGASVTNLKLQKLIYFVYKKHLKDTGYALFGDFFEVWTYGPVLPSVYHAFKRYGANDIDDYAYSTYDSSKRILIVSSSDTAFYGALEWVWTVYGNSDAISLVGLTHKEGTAWHIADKRKSAYLDDLDIMQEEWHFDG